MEEDVLKLKRKLLNAVDRNHNVRDAESITEVLEILENTEVDETILRSTRVGKIVNDLRRQLKDKTLARRAKQLVKRWRNYVVFRAGEEISSDTQMDSVKNCVNGKEISREWAGNGNSKTIYDSKISKEQYCCLGTSANTTRSSSVQKQEPAGEVFENKMLNGSLNRFVEGKCKNLTNTIRGSKEMVATMNQQDLDAIKLCSMTEREKSHCERIVYSGHKIKQLSCSAKTIQVSTNFTPRKKVKTTQELIKTVLSNSDIPQEGARLHVISQTNEHMKTTCELKLQPKEAFEPSSTPVNEHSAPSEDSNNGEIEGDTFAECLSTAQSTVNHKNTIIEDIDLFEQTEDASHSENVEEVQCEVTASACELNVTDSVVHCEEAVSAGACEDLNCSSSFMKVEGVTGIFDEGPRRSRTDDGFREWHECLSKTSYKGELLGILPYVIID